ncbi:hypothetical protein DVH05_003940 [Phytophthora capsici]|nr:hypothetical protein DVH05_003940 [Phytophthora capsici]
MKSICLNSDLSPLDRREDRYTHMPARDERTEEGSAISSRIRRHSDGRPQSDRQLRAGNSELNYTLATLGFERDNDSDEDFVDEESLPSEESDADDQDS